MRKLSSLRNNFFCDDKTQNSFLGIKYFHWLKSMYPIVFENSEIHFEGWLNLIVTKFFKQWTVISFVPLWTLFEFSWAFI